MPRPRALARRSTELAALVLTLVLLPLTAVAMPVEGYAPYQPQKNCNPTAKPGTLELARWLQRRYPGTGSLGISRACGHGGVSEHKEGRAFDWKVDASSAKDRARVQDFLSRVLATDEDGNEAALARRMGIMYILWNDHSWASYRGFAKADYRSSACRSLKKCSQTLRHRDHVHISLSRAGARGDTSWYHRNDPTPPRPAPTPTPAPEPTPAPDEPPADAVPARVLDFSERPYARFSVPADGTPVRARLALAAGATYKVTASGLITYGRPSQVADAACVWTADGWTARPPAKVRGSHGSLNLTVNGRAVLGTECRSKHTYKTTLTPRRKTGLTLRVANDGPPAEVPGGRIVVVVSRVRTKVAEALPTRSTLTPAPKTPKDAPRGYGLLAETVTVPADRPTVTTRQELQGGARYRVTVTGVASLGDGVRTDGRCVEVGGSWFGSAPIDRRRPDQDHGDLYLDGAAYQGRSQGDGCEAHHYVGSLVAARSGRLTLGLWDPLDRSDNSGAVTVTLQRLTGLTTPTAGTAAKPRKKDKAWRKGREWFEVPVDRAKGVQSTLRYRKGEKVQLVVRGTVRSHGVRADAACVSTPDGWLRQDPAVAVRQDPLELWVDGAPVRWRAIGPTSPCSDEHTYTVRHTVAKSGRLRLALLDLDHRDNTGTLRVTLLRQR
jgi:hypothetical protein